MRIVIDRGDFWEFKARTAALDLELAKLRTQLAMVAQQRNAIVDAFAATHGFDGRRPLTLDDGDCSVSQASSDEGQAILKGSR